MAAFVRTAALVLALAVACGGQSIRYVEDGDATGGEGDDPSPGARGGETNGGQGGTGAIGGTGISGSFTGGTFPAGGTGGTFAGGSGGTIPVGGTGTGGVGTGGDPGTGGGCSFSNPEPVIYWDFDGTIFANTNPYGINGGWYTFDDCADASAAGLPCTIRTLGLIGPDGSRGWSVRPPNTVCASGTAPRVELGPDGAPAYGLQWGFGLGFSLNQGAPFDARSRCIRGFEFVLTGSAPATLRINVVTPKTIGASHFVETALSASAFVDFAAVRQGPWVTNPSPLDISQVTDIQFHVHTNEQSATFFEFCVSLVSALR